MSVVIDILMAILLIYLALRCMLAPELSKTIFTFFAFGLTLALAWIRLEAVDVAIAEAAIASGFMGVLLLDSLRDFSYALSKNPKNLELPENFTIKESNKSLLLPRLALGIGFVIFLLISMEATWKTPEGGGLTAVSEELLPQSGVEHPVTAVLLNFRAYDTWLEIGVILMGLLAIFAAGGVKNYRKPSMTAVDPLLRQVILFFIPVLFLFGAFLLYFGKTGPGGAFQAAVLWGSIGILFHLGGWPIFAMIPRKLRQFLLTMGLGSFLILGFLLMAAGGAMFEYPPAYAGILILIAETLAAISIAVALTAIYVYLTK
ncbi:MAG: DUF4040 domain-containing protein [Cyclobacteriaceae bacterium]|nr:DUF4040 domain-containing protein [Cyclobacteriaceae bacterium]